MAGEVVYFLLIEVDLIVIRLGLLLYVIPVEIPHHQLRVCMVRVQLQSSPGYNSQCFILWCRGGSIFSFVLIKLQGVDFGDLHAKKEYRILSSIASFLVELIISYFFKLTLAVIL